MEAAERNEIREGNIQMLNMQELMAYLTKHHGIAVRPEQVQALRNLGYYHGFKGYRFVRQPSQRIVFSSLDEVIALNAFDMNLKALLYPKVMFIENALKSYVIEAVLMDSGSEYLDDIFHRSMTHYRSYTPGSESYQKQYAKRMTLKGKINSALLRDYSNQKQTVNHFFNGDKPIPIWAIFESLTLGEFGTFFSCANQNVKRYTSTLLQLPTNLDADGKLTEFIIYCIKDLRNAVAHNNTIFDTRFQTGKINRRLIALLEAEVGLTGLDFKYIGAYVILVAYVLRKMGESVESCEQFVDAYIHATDKLREQLSGDICNQILGTHQRKNMVQLRAFFSCT